MIAFLRGILRAKEQDRAIIDVGGVGFDLSIPLSTLRQLPSVEESVFLRTILVLREDEARLFGFATVQEQEMFSIITQVPGVGLKMALDILSTFPPDRFAATILAGDHTSLCRVPGIGKKRAERLIFDLKGNEALLTLGKVGAVSSEQEKPLPAAEGVFEQAVQALMALGCKPSTAHRAVSESLSIVGEKAPVEALIKEALQHR